MTETKFVTKLLKLKGLKVVDLGFNQRSPLSDPAHPPGCPKLA